MDNIKEWRGLWLPEHEHHLLEWMTKVNKIVDGKPAYQYHKLEASLAYCKNFRTAVDVGGHCGLLSMHLAKRFSTLHAFEPVALHRECWQLNVQSDTCATELHACALGDRDGMISMHTSNGSSGDSWIDGDGDIPLKRLDSFELQDVDYLKLDCEGSELLALRGGEETIKRCKPTIMVEQKPNRAEKFGLRQAEAVDYLKSLGYELRKVMSGDYIMTAD